MSANPALIEFTPAPPQHIDDFINRWSNSGGSERANYQLFLTKLGAHFTPRAYVERLVMPTLIDPLPDQWRSVQVAAEAWLQQGKADKGLAELRGFHHQLCQTRVLDPACGSGNFLYVAPEHMKRLEGEVLNLIRDLSAGQGSFDTQGLTVDPHQFLGLELNPRAAAIAEIVLWIGYLQWHRL